jgi:hypothetical protein
MGEGKKSFPDLTGDGKVTKADILKGRGVELKEVVVASDMTTQEASGHAERFAKYMSDKEGKDFSVTIGSVDGPSFDLDLDGEPYEGGSYIISTAGEILNMALPEHPVYANITMLEDKNEKPFTPPSDPIMDRIRAAMKRDVKKAPVKEYNNNNDESLALTFRDKNEFERAKEHFASSSDFSPFDINDEFKTFFFEVEDQADADSTEFYLTQELEGDTDLYGYFFSMEPSPLSEDMSKYKVGDKIKWSSPKGKVEDEIVGIDGIYIKLKSGGSIPYQSIVSEDLDLGHEDNEPHMIKGDLYRIGKYAMELYAMVEELEETGQEIDFPAWWQAMITNSKEQMVKSKHYLDFELKEPAIDAMVDAATGEAPHMGEPMMEDKGDKHVVMKGSKYYTGTDFVSDIKNAMRYNIDSATMVAKREKGMVYTPKKMNENSAEETLAGKIAKALKDMANKDASDQNNLKQARTALNKGNMDAAEKIAKPYLSEKIAKYLKENIGLKKGDTVEYEGNKYKIGSFDTEANLVYLNTIDNKPAEDSKGSYLKVNATRVKKTK